MSFVSDLFKPVSLGVAVVGAAASSVAFIGIGIAAMATRGAVFGVGVGIMLIVYGLFVGMGAYLGFRRSGLARGLIVAPALLHLASCVSLAMAGDIPQLVGSVVAGLVFVVIVVAALLPATREALS